MILSFFIAWSWLLIASALQMKKYSRQEFAFVFLTANFINTNLYYLFGETFRVFQISKDPSRYVSFTLLQSVIVPLFIAVMANLLVQVRTGPKKAFVIIASIGVLIGIEGLSYGLDIVSYDKLPVFFYLAGYRILLFLLPLTILGSFRRMCRRESA